jgi:hypothetical protein
MKCDLHLQRHQYLLLPLLFFVAVAILASMQSESEHLNNVSSNPQDFFVWATTSSVIYSFRYDPRAADEWLFHSGAWLFGTSQPPGTGTMTYWPISVPPKDVRTQPR